MTPNRKTFQTTVKMEPSLRDEIDQAAAAPVISSMEFIRRACREKISGGSKASAEEIRAVVLEVLKEQGLEEAGHDV